MTPTGLTLDQTTLSLEVGGTATLVATVIPNNAADKTVTYVSDKPAIATIDKGGKVIAISEGDAVITAKTINDKTATCAVTIKIKGA